jgi:hypothetical protein
MKVKSLIIVALLLTLFSSNVYAASLPASMGISWKSTKEKTPYYYINVAGNGYKGLNSVKEYKLINSKGKILYRYKSPKKITDSILYKDGTSYILEGNNWSTGDIVALTPTGKVKWRKSFNQYTEIRLNLEPDGSFYITGFSKKKDSWYILRLDPKNGNTIWSSPHQGPVAIGSNGNVLIPNGNRLEKFSFYKNGKLLWQGTTPTKNNEVESAYISSKGNVAVVSKTGDMNYYIQLYNSNGKKLLVRKLSNDKEQIGQVIFNNKGELLITIVGIYTGKLNLEWYNTAGRIIKKSSFPIPKLPNTHYAESYTEREFIVKADDAKNIYLHTTCDIIYKYNVSGKLVGKTIIPTDLEPQPHFYSSGSFATYEKSFGLIYSKYDLKTKTYYYVLYTYR